jgi:hypothetical protein
VLNRSARNMGYRGTGSSHASEVTTVGFGGAACADRGRKKGPLPSM